MKDEKNTVILLYIIFPIARLKICKQNQYPGTVLVSLTSVLGKIMQQILLKAIMKHMDD